MQIYQVELSHLRSGDSQDQKTISCNETDFVIELISEFNRITRTHLMSK